LDERRSTPSRLVHRLLAVSAWFAAALVVALPALRQPAWLTEGRAPADAAWWGAARLVAGPEQGSGAILAWRLAVVALLTFGATRVARCAAAWGAKPLGRFASGLLFVASSAATSVLWDRDGIVLLVPTLLFLAFVEQRLTAPRASGGALLLAALASATSHGALLPVVVAAWLLLVPDVPDERPPARGRFVVGALLLPAWLLLQVFWRAPAGDAAGPTLAGVADATARDSAFALRDAARSLIEGGFGFLAERPFVSNWLPSLGSSALSASALLLGLAILTTGTRRAAARGLIGGMLLLLVPVLACAIGRPLALVPFALALPGLGVVVAAAGAVQGRVAVAGGAAVVVLQLAGLAGVAGREQSLHDSVHPAAVVRAAAIAGDDALLEPAVVAASGAARPLAPSVERQLGLLRLERLERAGLGDEALDWIERWLATRAPTAAPLHDLEARRVELLLERRGVDAAAELLTQQLATRGDDVAFTAAVAGVMVDALHRHAQERLFVDRMLPLVERLLARAAERPGVATAAELECLALLRVGQQRLVEAVTLAEAAIAKSPDRARPHLVLARIYLGRGEIEAGLLQVRDARKLDPADAAALLLEGRLFCSNADLAERGVAKMVQALADDPTLSGARDEIAAGALQAADVLGPRGQLALARKLLLEAIDVAGRRPALLRALAHVARQERALSAAAALLEELLLAAPDDASAKRDLAETSRDLGYAHLLRHERAEAVACFERALAVAPADFEKGGMETVVRQFRNEQEAALKPEAIAARAAYDQALRLDSEGDRDGAAKAMLDSIGLLPMNPLAHYHLGRIELARGRAKEAEAALRTAIAVGAVQAIDVEEAWPLLLQALVDQKAAPAKVKAAVDEYLKGYPNGRYRAEFEKLRLQ